MHAVGGTAMQLRVFGRTGMQLSVLGFGCGAVGGLALSVRQVLGDVVPAFERLRQQGKTRFLGITAVGDTAALHQVLDARAFDSAQVVYNMLNPSAAVKLPTNYPAQDYGRLFDRTKAT